MSQHDREISTVINEMLKYDSSLKEVLNDKQYRLFVNLYVSVSDNSHVWETLNQIKKNIHKLYTSCDLWMLWHTKIDKYILKINKSPIFVLNTLYNMTDTSLFNSEYIYNNVIHIEKILIDIQKYCTMLDRCIELLEYEQKIQELHDKTLISYLLSLVKLYKIYVFKFLHTKVSDHYESTIREFVSSMRIYTSNLLKDNNNIPINTDESNIMLFDRNFINPWDIIDRISFAHIIFSYYMVAYVSWEYKSHVSEIFKVAMDDRRKWIELYIQSALHQKEQLEVVVEKLQYILEDVDLPIEYTDDLERYSKTFLTSFNSFDTDLIVYKNKKYGPI